MKILRKIRANLRLIIQIIFTAITNGNIMGFFQGRIHRGASKLACVPGLNCYSCPGALGSCPIGSLQAVLNSRDYSFSFYVGGFLTSVGAVSGRFTCGYLCPFGLIQDLVHRIPIFRKRKNLPLEKYLRKLKYLILLVFVLVLPGLIVDFTGMGSPYFCKYICPSGTILAGLPLILRNSYLRTAAGGLFLLKLGILILILVLSIKTYRPFCKYICPLGAIYSFFNPIAIYRFKVSEACIKCNKCREACKLDIKVYEEPNSLECIRCGDCIRACPVDAIETSLQREKGKLRKEN